MINPIQSIMYIHIRTCIICIYSGTFCHICILINPSNEDTFKAKQIIKGGHTHRSMIMYIHVRLYILCIYSGTSPKELGTPLKQDTFLNAIFVYLSTLKMRIPHYSGHFHLLHCIYPDTKGSTVYILHSYIYSIYTDLPSFRFRCSIERKG